MAHANFKLFKQQEAFNQASFQGHFGRTDRYAEQVSDPPLKLLLDFLAKKDIATDSIRQLPAPYADCWQAWLAYNRGQLEQASALFASCHAGLEQEQDAALGDLFVRTGHHQQALFCLNTAHQLLPPGAGERSRQMNYLATALLRLNTRRDQAAAEDLLMQSYYLARDTGDLTSILHSMARLQFLYLDRHQPEVDVCQLLELQPDNKSAHPLHQVPLGFLALGRSLAAMQLAHKDSAATTLAQQACEHLKNHPAEYYWALSLHSFLHSNTAQLPGLQLPEIQLHQAPASYSVINQQWQDIPLQDTCSRIFKPKLQQQSLLQHRQVFFI